MPMKACPPEVLTHFKAKIDALGIAQNEPNLYDQVYGECVNKKSFVFTGCAGCVVLKPIAGPGVLIWIALGSEPKVDIAKHLEDIEYLSDCIDADFIELYTRRKGFRRVLPALGFREEAIELDGQAFSRWEKRLTPCKNMNNEVTYGIESQTGV